MPLKEDWREYVEREVKPFVPDAWVDENHRDARDREVGRVGYEINFNRYFYRYVPPRPARRDRCRTEDLEAEIAGLLREVVVNPNITTCASTSVNAARHHPFEQR